MLSLVGYLIWAGWEVGPGTQVWILVAMAVIAGAGSAAGTQFAKHACRSRSRKDSRGEALRLLALFGVVTLGGGIAAAAGNLADPKVRSAAVLLLDSPPRVLGGIYVGQTSDRVYIAEAVKQDESNDLGDRAQGRLLELKRALVGRLLIATSQSLHKALDQETELCAQLKATIATSGVESNCDKSKPWSQAAANSH